MPSRSEHPFIIIQDSREQTPFDFGRWPLAVGTLETGDYSIKGLEPFITIERKSLQDLIGCCAQKVNRNRFERELRRMRGYRCRAVVVAAEMGDIAQENYRSAISAKSVMGSTASWYVKYEVPFLMAGGSGAEITISLLRKFYDYNRSMLKAYGLDQVEKLTL